MATAINRYKPDYAVPSGWILEEHLEARGFSHTGFARMCRCSAKLIGEVVSGKVPLDPKLARAFEKILGLEANIWLGIESDYRRGVRARL